MVPPNANPQVTQFLEGPTLLIPFNKEGVPTIYNGYLDEKFQCECQLHERFIMIFFYMVRKEWRCCSFMYALLHSFLLCKENLCWNPHFFCCSIIEVSFSYKVYAWTEYWKIIHSLIAWVSEICLMLLIALFWNFPLFWNFLLMICNFLLMFSHFKNIWMSTLTTIIITC